MSITTRTKIIIASIFVILVIVCIAVAVGVHFGKDSNDDDDDDADKNKVFDLKIQTECGPVLGSNDTVNDMNGKPTIVYAYKGIPFAKPPIGALRWNPPVRLGDDKGDCWKGTLVANISGNKCFQESNGTENCLLLNVFTPDVDGKLPVFVWIYGGSLMTGSLDITGYSPDAEFTASMNVVSVSFNYRLNAFGFLALKELRKNGTSGNYGFMDQILALKWIQNNIKNFGGDPDSVTICGQSSGGTSIIALLASPSAAGLFHKAIPMSSSARLEKSFADAEKDNRVFLNKTKCRLYNDTVDIRNCLYNLTALEVTEAIPLVEYPNWEMTDFEDIPTKGVLSGALAVVDGKVVVKPPRELANIDFKSKDKVSVLIGNTAQEIAFNPAQKFEGPNAWNDFSSLLKTRLDAFSPSYINKVWGDLYKNETDSNGTLTHSAQYVFETMVTDIRVTCPTVKLIQNLKKSSRHNIFKYIVTNAPSQTIRLAGYTWKNAFHLWDSYALFGYKVLVWVHPLGEREINFMKSMRATILKFMKEGTVDWHPDQTGIFNLKGGIDVMNETFHGDQCEFWNDDDNGFVPYSWIN